MAGGTPESYIFFEVDGRCCCVPLTQNVRETMRPRPLEHREDLPAFVAGASLIRGAVTPVIDLGVLLDGVPLRDPGRLILLEPEGRPVGVLVSRVLGVRPFSEDLVDAPPLLKSDASEAVARLGQLDGALLSVLQLARLVPDDAWTSDGEGG